MATVEEQRTMIAIQQLNRKVPEVTLRDLFAMSALSGTLGGKIFTYEEIKFMAEESYKVADIMLEARQKK